MSNLSVIGISGSLRKDSSNIKLLNCSGNKLKKISKKINFSLVEIDFPLYNEDTEKSEGLPKAVEKLGKETSIIFVDMHAETTSEKIAMGRFLDGRVSAVVGTHTHVQTADEQIFPGGTAFL